MSVCSVTLHWPLATTVLLALGKNECFFQLGNAVNTVHGSRVALGTALNLDNLHKKFFVWSFFKYIRHDELRKLLRF